MQEKDHLDKIKKIWDYVNDKEQQKPDNPHKNDLDKMERACAIGAHQYIENYLEEKESFFGNLSDDPNSKNNLLLNALKTLQKNKKNPKIVHYTAEIVNLCFPEFDDEAKNLAKKLDF